MWELFGYLHQDWRLDYADWTEAFDDFSDDMDAAQLTREVDEILASHLSDDALAELILALGAAGVFYGTDGTVGGWLRELRDLASTTSKDS